MDRSSSLIAFVLLLLIDSWRIECRPNAADHHSVHVQACGSNLADILQRTCSSGFNPYYRNDEDQYVEQENQSDDDSHKSRKLRKRGIIQECCIQSCTLADIFDYCYDGSNVTIKQKSRDEYFARHSESTSTSRNDVKLSMKNNEIIMVERTNELIENTKAVKTKPALGINNNKMKIQTSEKNRMNSSSTENSVTWSTTENLRHAKTTKPRITRPPITITTRTTSKMIINLINSKKS